MSRLMRFKVTLRLLWLTAIILFGVSVAAYASGTEETDPANPNGIILFVKGDVSMNGSQVEPGQSVAPGSNVKTGPGSSVEMVFGERNIVELRENSEVDVNFDDSQGRIEMKKGTVAVVLRKTQLLFGITGGMLTVATPLAEVEFSGRALWVKIEDADNTYISPALGRSTLADINGENKIDTDAVLHESAYRFTRLSDGSIKRSKARGQLGHNRTDFDRLGTRVRAPLSWGKNLNCADCDTSVPL